MDNWDKLERWEAKRVKFEENTNNLLSRFVILFISVCNLEYFQFRKMISKQVSASDGLMFDYKGHFIKVCFSDTGELCSIVNYEGYPFCSDSFSVISCMLAARSYIDMWCDNERKVIKWITDCQNNCLHS